MTETELLILKIGYYFTSFAIIFISHAFVTTCYLLAGKKFKKLTRDNDFVLTIFFRYRSDTWHYFWLSSLWLIVYYSEHIINFLESL